MIFTVDDKTKEVELVKGKSKKKIKKLISEYLPKGYNVKIGNYVFVKETE